MGKRDAADGGRPKVGSRLLDRTHRAENLIAWLAPLRDERRVDNLLAAEEVVELSRELLLAVVEVVNVTVLLIVNPVDGPRALRLRG